MTGNNSVSCKQTSEVLPERSVYMLQKVDCIFCWHCCCRMAQNHSLL